MKKIVALLMSILLVIGAMPTITAFATSEEVPEGYIGIYDIEDLYCIRYDLDKNYILMADIDMTEATAEGGDWDNGYGWAPIGEDSTIPFTGIFDGNGHTIKGMQINGIKTSYAGLFGYVKDGEVKNFTISEAKITTANNCIYAGTVAGVVSDSIVSDITIDVVFKVSNDNGNTYVGGAIGNIGSSTANNIKVNGTIDCKAELWGTINLYAGGISGYLFSATVRNCTNNATLSSFCKGNYTGYCSANCYSGGITGFIAGTSVVGNSYNTGDVSARANQNNNHSCSSSSSYSGGIVGNEEYSKCTIKNCYNTGVVSSVSEEASNRYAYSGGIVGSGSATSCINLGNVTCNSNGGSQTQISSIANNTISNCYYLRDTAPSGKYNTTDTATTAVALSAAQMKLKGVFGYLDFENTWFIDTSTGIEHPQLISNPEVETDHKHNCSAVVTPPTCKEKGYTTYTCSCGYSYVADYTETVSHTPELINDVEPTETESGYSGDYVCSVCHETISTGRVIPATGHVHTYAEWTTAIEAGCTTSGLEYSLCTGCSMISFRKIDAKNHVDEDKNGICDTCEESLSAGCKHKYEMVVADATCTEKGTVTMTCSLCKDTITAEIPAKGHNYVDFVVAPTCEEDGYTRHICSLCGDEHTDTPVKATGHSMRVQKITPTCTENGCDIHVCSKCGYNYFDNETLKLNHSPILVNAKEATQGKDGYTGDVVCERCEEMLKKGEVIHSHAVRSVSIDDLSMNYKNTTTITPKIEADDGVTYTVEYTTSNPNVATVDNDGNVYAAKRGSGSATITCTVTDQYGNVVTDECKVNVSLTFVQKLIVYVLFGWIWY